MKMATIKELEKEISSIKERLSVLENPVEKEISAPVALVEESDPIDLSYRQEVDNVLNKFFGIILKNGVHLNDNVDGFNFTIIVPDKYSSLHPDQKDVIGGDVRTKAIPYALKEIGVRDWAQTVFNTFSEDIKGQITEDRLKDSI